ncbi:hypothetical protein TNCV_2993671 [Trichonephila clavipes]|nr:hypothetical protein TNCV_2993671 [Trichonephila clavipes]
MHVDSASQTTPTTLESRQRSLAKMYRGSENASPVFEHLFRQSMTVQVLMCEWGSYTPGREMNLPRNIATQMREQHCLELPHWISEFMFSITGMKRSKPKDDATTTKLYSRHKAIF